MSQCASIASSSTSPQSDCEATLASNGFSKCSSACATFGKSAPSPGGATSGGTAQLGDFCAKCASCVGTSGFKEGFCTPFVSAEGFDLAACTAGGSVAELARPSIAKSELSSLSCSGFDEAE